ncbi:hypothetical protein E2C01_044108 [Portunus trituberculatus]|uniref:Uncharacterized protein n=1 Tax=Portunus trituberculatus TaxID=210409 RepID=A0A5B7G1D5_PORTR|nr:hypothetical protein [Portunus trituberculatus]
MFAADKKCPDIGFKEEHSSVMSRAGAKIAHSASELQLLISNEEYFCNRCARQVRLGLVWELAARQMCLSLLDSHRY